MCGKLQLWHFCLYSQQKNAFYISNNFFCTQIRLTTKRNVFMIIKY